MDLNKRELFLLGQSVKCSIGRNKRGGDLASLTSELSALQGRLDKELKSRSRPPIYSFSLRSLTEGLKGFNGDEVFRCFKKVATDSGYTVTDEADCNFRFITFYGVEPWVINCTGEEFKILLELSRAGDK